VGRGRSPSPPTTLLHEAILVFRTVMLGRERSSSLPNTCTVLITSIRMVKEKVVNRLVGRRSFAPPQPINHFFLIHPYHTLYTDVWAGRRARELRSALHRPTSVNKV